MNSLKSGLFSGKEMNKQEMSDINGGIAYWTYHATVMVGPDDEIAKTHWTTSTLVVQDGKWVNCGR